MIVGDHPNHSGLEDHALLEVGHTQMINDYYPEMWMKEVPSGSETSQVNQIKCSCLFPSFSQVDQFCFCWSRRSFWIVFDPKSPWGPWCWSQNHLTRNVATDHGLHWGAHLKITLKHFKRSCNLVCIEVFFKDRGKIKLGDCGLLCYPKHPMKTNQTSILLWDFAGEDKSRTIGLLSSFSFQHIPWNHTNVLLS